MSRALLRLVLFCFFLSGFSSLLFEVVWTRSFALVVGTTELAVAWVLAAFMGGLGAGAFAASRFIHKVSRPAQTYGLVEIFVAVYATALPYLLRGLHWLYVACLGHQAVLPESGLGWGQTPIFAFVVILLFPPTFLMGTTLPLLTRLVVSSEKDMQYAVGWLYAANTAGAILGALAGAFFFIPVLGLSGSTYVGVGINVSIAALVLIFCEKPCPTAVLPKVRSSMDRAPMSTVLLWLVAAAGVMSFSAEIVWTRLLGHILGGSLAAFATMLGSFLLGIALGSEHGTSYCSTRSAALRMLAWVWILAGSLLSLSYLALDFIPLLDVYLSASYGRSQIRMFLFSAAVMIPFSYCLGMAFPLAVRAMSDQPDATSRSAALVYFSSTIGAMIGPPLCAFLLLPVLGFTGCVVLIALFFSGLALAVSRAWDRFIMAGLAASLAAAGLVLYLQPTVPHRLLKYSSNDGRVATWKLDFVDISPGATVVLLSQPGAWHLRVNGMPEATIYGKGARPGMVQINDWLTALPLLFAPAVSNVLFVGLGGGLSMEAVPERVRQVDALEIEHAVIAANRHVAATRLSNPLSDPRVHIYVNDARMALALSDAHYDAIISQPSHPWTAGASHLYTREFFSCVKDNLAAQGVFVQWMNIHFVDPPILQSLIRSLLDVFDQVYVFRPTLDALVFLASDRSLPLPDEAGLSDFLKTELALRTGIQSREDVLSAWVANTEEASAFAGSARPITDDWNPFTGSRYYQYAKAMDASLMPFVSELSSSAQRAITNPTYMVRRLLAKRLNGAAENYLKTLADPGQYAAAQGWMALANQSFREARDSFCTALDFTSSSEEATAGLHLLQPQLAQEGRSVCGSAAAATNRWVDAQNALLEACQGLDWAKAAALDALISTISVQDAMYPAITRTRCYWRMKQGGAERARECLDLMDRLLPNLGAYNDLWIRADAAEAAGQWDALISTLYCELLPLHEREMLPAMKPRLQQLMDAVKKAGY